MNFNFLAGTALFQGVSPSDLKSMLHCLEAEEKFYEKGSTILHAGNCSLRCSAVAIPF